MSIARTHSTVYPVHHTSMLRVDTWSKLSESTSNTRKRFSIPYHISISLSLFLPHDAIYCNFSLIFVLFQNVVKY